MNRALRSSKQLPSGFQAELQRTRSLLGRWLGHQLNVLFDLSVDGGRRRRTRMLLLAFVPVVLAIALRIIMFSQTDRGLSISESSSQFLLSALVVLLIAGIATSVALNAAGSFLEDIFELKDVRVAWRFVGNLASGTTREVLHLRAGAIAEADRDSPMVLIGGPGRVLVESDTAALFEKPNGMSHVVGPARRKTTDDGSTGRRAMLDGFERLRAPVINLRDQYIGGPAGEPMTVVGRSLDGMPVGISDVRGVFSVRRDAGDGEADTTLVEPYPIRARDIENLIYNQAVEVLTGEKYPSDLPPDWTRVMRALIRDSLREFMSQNPLSEYLAGVGVQEAELSEFREDTILSKALQIASEVSAATPQNTPSKTSFHPRTEVSARFKKYSSEFSTRAQEHGLELHWIGVGTWQIPDEESGAIVNDKNVEAWRMNRENARRSDPKALELIVRAAMVDGKLRLIQETPIQSHEKNKSRYSDKGVLIECLLQNFWEQLGDALDVYYRNRTRAPDLGELEEAVRRIEELLKIPQVGHAIGGGTMSRVHPRPAWAAQSDAPPAPASKAEANKYQELLGRLDGNYKVAEAMIANETRRHGDLSREELITRILQRFERHGR